MSIPPHHQFQQQRKPLGCFKIGLIIIGSLFAFGVLLLIFVAVFIGSSSDSKTNKSTPEPEIVKVVDTTSPDYIINKLSSKSKLTKAEKKELKEAKEGKEIMEMEAANERRVEEIKQMKADFEEKQMSSWDGSCIPLERYIKRTLHDPDSYEHVETRFAPDGDENFVWVSTTFRARNAFGALVLTTIKAKVGYDGTIISTENF